MISATECPSKYPSEGPSECSSSKPATNLPSAGSAYFVVRFDEATGTMIAVTQPIPGDAANRLGRKLAIQHPGVRFYVMQALRMLRSAGVEIHELGADPGMASHLTATPRPHPAAPAITSTPSAIDTASVTPDSAAAHGGRVAQTPDQPPIETSGVPSGETSAPRRALSATCATRPPWAADMEGGPGDGEAGNSAKGSADGRSDDQSDDQNDASLEAELTQFEARLARRGLLNRLRMMRNAS